TTNNSGGTLTGGTWVATASGKGATVSITGGAVSSDAAKIVLSGLGSVLQAGNGSTFTPIENSLTTIAASSGELDVLNNRNYVIGVPALADNGKIVLGGGTLNGGALTIGSTGMLIGFGTIADPTNNGTLDASGGDLSVSTPIAGTGTLQIESASELAISGA